MQSTSAQLRRCACTARRAGHAAGEQLGFLGGGFHANALKLKDCFLTVLALYTLLEATKLVEFNKPALVNKNTMVVLHFGIDRRVSVMRYHSYLRKV